MTILKIIRRWTCRFLEEEAAVRGNYQEALYWAKQGEQYR